MELLLNFSPFGVNMSILTDESVRPVKVNVIVLCNTHTREMLLSLPAAPACLLLLCAAPLPLLLCHFGAAQMQLVWLCNHWVRLHCCTLPVLLLKLSCSFSVAWVGLGWRVQTFFVSELVWLGFMEISGIFHKSCNFTNCPVSPIVHLFPPSFEENNEWRNVQGNVPCNSTK